MKSILITVCARLSRFDIKEVRELMEDDEIELDMLGDRKTALFIVTSDTTKAFDFIGTIMYTQLFNLLCEKADKNGGRLKIHVHCIMDEFANLGKIPDWERLISTIRSREISASIILQSLAQLKSVYEKDADTISDNCDTFLFLGGKGKDTLKDISEMLGKQTIDMYNNSVTKGNNPSYGMNYQRVGRELFTPDELGRLAGNKCILENADWTKEAQNRVWIDNNGGEWPFTKKGMTEEDYDKERLHYFKSNGFDYLHYRPLWVEKTISEMNLMDKISFGYPKNEVKLEEILADLDID